MNFLWKWELSVLVVIFVPTVVSSSYETTVSIIIQIVRLLSAQVIFWDMLILYITRKHTLTSLLLNQSGLTGLDNGFSPVADLELA